MTMGPTIAFLPDSPSVRILGHSLYASTTGGAGLVFSTTDPQVCWEGKGKATAVDTNVYLYVIDYERMGCPDGVQLSGLVHLVR